MNNSIIKKSILDKKSFFVSVSPFLDDELVIKVKDVKKMLRDQRDKTLSDIKKTVISCSEGNDLKIDVNMTHINKVIDGFIRKTGKKEEADGE